MSHYLFLISKNILIDRKTIYMYKKPCRCSGKFDVQLQKGKPVKKNEIDSLLMTVALENVVRIHKKKLLWMLGWKYDKAGAWQHLLEAWNDLDYDSSCFYGFEEGGYIVLISCSSEIVKVDQWAG